MEETGTMEMCKSLHLTAGWFGLRLRLFIEELNEVLIETMRVSSDLAGAAVAHHCLWQSIRMTTQKTC